MHMRTRSRVNHWIGLAALAATTGAAAAEISPASHAAPSTLSTRPSAAVLPETKVAVRTILGGRVPVTTSGALRESGPAITVARPAWATSPAGVRLPGTLTPFQA